MMVKKSLSVTLVCTYRPPGNVSAAFCTELSALLDHLLASGRRFAICGDFNYPGKDEGSLDDDLMDMLGSHNLMQHVSESTHNDGNILDLVITLSAESRVSQFSTQPAFFSDHKLVLYRLHMPRPEPVVVTRTYRDIRKIDIESFQRDVLSSAVYTDDISHHTADSYAELFSTEVNRLPDVGYMLLFDLRYFEVEHINHIGSQTSPELPSAPVAV